MRLHICKLELAINQSITQIRCSLRRNRVYYNVKRRFVNFVG